MLGVTNSRKVGEKTPQKPVANGADMVKRDSKGRILPGSVLNPTGGRPRNRLKILDEKTRTLVMTEVVRILTEGESNQHFQPVLLKVMDKAMPTLKAVQMDIEGHQQLGVIVLPAKVPIDGEVLDAEVMRVDTSHPSDGEE